MISSPRIVPWRNCLWDSSHYSSLLCVRSAVCLLCSPTSACTAPLWSYSSKRKKKDFFPCFTGTINVPWPSRLLLLSFSLILSLFPSPLWGFFSLLDGAEAEPQTNFSHSRNEAWRAQFVSLRGNRIHSSVPQKTPFFQTERELFVWWQLQLSSRSSCDSLQVQRCVMACCVHITGELCHHARWCLWRINQTVHRVPFSKMELPNDSKCEKQSTRNSSFDSSVLKKTLHEYQSHSMVLKRERSRGGLVPSSRSDGHCWSFGHERTLDGPPVHLTTHKRNRHRGSWSELPSKPYVRYLLSHSENTWCVLFFSSPPAEVKSQIPSRRLSPNNCSAVYCPIKSTPALFPFIRSDTLHLLPLASRLWFALISQWTSPRHVTVFNS